MVYFFILMAFAKPDANPWGKISTPISSASSQIYGSYTSGCITNAETLPLEGAGYEVVNPYRNRYHAHPSLTRLIKTLGMWAQSNKLGKVIIGDIAQPAGGPLTGAHKSHQIGLDADIRMHLLTPGKTIANKNNFNSTDVVTCQAQKNKFLKYKFHADRWPISSTQLLQRLASEDTVERIFVSAGIKKHLCESFPDNPEWLRKVRPEWGHTGHLHVRLRCPMGMPSCDGQSPVFRDPSDKTEVGCDGNDYKAWFQASNLPVNNECVPISPDDPKPYWERVMSSSKFPKECAELVKK